MKFAAIIALSVVLAAPVCANEFEELGTLNASCMGETIVQPTVLFQLDDGKTSAMAFWMAPGGGVSMLSLSGYVESNARLDISINYMAPEPGPETAPFAVEISYKPASTKGLWISDEAPAPATVNLTTLENDGAEGRAVGTFSAVLCYAKDYGSEADTDNCHPIEGSFDTRFMVE